MWTENEEVWEIWQDVKTQWRGSGMGIIGLDYAEVRRAAKDLGIKYGTRNKRKIKVIERIILDSVNKSDT